MFILIPPRHSQFNYYCENAWKKRWECKQINVNESLYWLGQSLIPATLGTRNQVQTLQFVRS